eukprot:TRINITY_DN20384_c0_g2_i1.p1 TRINITY_DN20384_c0_g2~~TRINITY_DN20384_c0_g2_i1.p1  ORF type:complete len:160 (-),score=24.60 TRINITY_DN20384_c0_g2_i1:7-486(-)
MSRLFHEHIGNHRPPKAAEHLLFHSSGTARRFPELVRLTEDRLVDLLELPPPQREALPTVSNGQARHKKSSKQNWRPAGRSRPVLACFEDTYRPFDAEAKQRKIDREKNQEKQQRVSSRAFFPASQRKAKEAIQRNYFLNSADGQRRSVPPLRALDYVL